MGGGELDFGGFLKYLKSYFVPSTHVNNFWKTWNEISQVKQSKIARISGTAIEIRNITKRLGTGVGVERIQKFLDVMHPELRFQVESGVTEGAEEAWIKLVRIAERKDLAIYQAGKYARSRAEKPLQQASSSAIN